MFTSCREALGIRRQAALRCSPLVRTPLVTGLLRPIVMLPAGPFSPEELRYIFLHELTHVKHHDLWVRAGVLAATALHWYNPVVYLLSRRVQTLSEQSYDERVVGSLSRGERYTYGKTILKVLSDMTAGTAEFAAPMSTRRTIERRLMRVLHPKQMSSRVKLLACLAAAAILTCGAAAALAVRAPLAVAESPETQEIPAAPHRESTDAWAIAARGEAVWFRPVDIHDLRGAELDWWDGQQLAPLAEDKSLPWLEEAFGGAEVPMSHLDGCFHSVLYLQRADGVLGKVLIAEHANAEFQSGGVTYRWSDGDSADLFALFGVTLDDLPAYPIIADAAQPEGVQFLDSPAEPAAPAPAGTDGIQEPAPAESGAQTAIRQLTAGISYYRGMYAFTLPEGPRTWKIRITGQRTGGDIRYLENETWTSGRSYQFKLSESCDGLTMDIEADGVSASVDLVSYITQPRTVFPDYQDAPQIYDSAVRGNTALILARGGTLLPDDDKESYCYFGGVYYKEFESKNSTDDCSYRFSEYEVGNWDALDEHKRKVAEETLVDGDYPRNSKGETYGSIALHAYVGYDPDLVAARGTRGESGYICRADENNIPHDLPKDECPHTFTVPLYDAEHTVIGEYEIGCGGHFSGGMSIEEAKEALANGDL